MGLTLPYRRGGNALCAVCNELSSGGRCTRCNAALCGDHDDEEHAFCEVCPTVVRPRWRLLLDRVRRRPATLFAIGAIAAAGLGALLL